MRRRGSAFAWCRQLLAWLVILGVAVVLAITVLVPRAAGATPYTILTGSMRPGLPPGTLVVVRPTPADEVRVGDVITFQLRSGEPTVVTHRVVVVGENGRGERVFRTQGDANEVADAEWVRPVQLKGVLWYDAPYLGRVTNLLDAIGRQLALVVVVGFLLLYAGLMFGSDLRDRQARRRSRDVAVAA
ncbi:MAG TPA: signal peptidase I [Marmoricola sp.]